jgi:hypothetical protein
MLQLHIVARNHMKYTLITSNGKVYTFFIQALALQFQQAYGGTIVTADVFSAEIVRSM